METRRLQYLYELARLGSMRAVADVLATTTSSVSQQIAQLSRETGATLLEPDGRGVRLTPAGRRLAKHARTILDAAGTAKLDVDPEAAPSGTLRIAGFATAIRVTLMPIIEQLAIHHRSVRIQVLEYEPGEALARLAADDIDLALTYDYNLAPDPAGPEIESLELWSAPWGLAVPADASRIMDSTLDAAHLLGAFRGRDWIGNSRNIADETVLRLLSSMAGFDPIMRHQADSLELVEDLVLAGLGIGLLPEGRPCRAGITILPLRNPDLHLRAFARTRAGRNAWPALALVLAQLRASTQNPD